MPKHPTIQTERLILRKFKLRDAKDLARIVGTKEIAISSLSFAYPYEEGAAESFINRQEGYFQRGVCFNLAIILKEENKYIGAVGFNEIYKKHNRADLGYYLDKNKWGKGFATEAVKAIIEYGFKIFELNKIEADAIIPNPSSTHVMEKAGMKHEGILRQHIKHWDEYRDMTFYGITLKDFKKQNKPSAIKTIS